MFSYGFILCDFLLLFQVPWPLNCPGKGKYVGNLKRDLMRQLPAPLFSTTPIRLPLKTAIKKEVTITQLATVPLLLPHDCFKQVWKSGSFERTVCEGHHVLEKFWEAVGDHPSLRFHRVKSTPGYQRRAVPLILHGDGAAVTQSIGSGSKSCMFLSWRSLVAKSRDNRDCHHLIGAIWSHLSCGKQFFQYFQ